MFIRLQFICFKKSSSCLFLVYCKVIGDTTVLLLAQIQIKNEENMEQKEMNIEKLASHLTSTRIKKYFIEFL